MHTHTYEKALQQLLAHNSGVPTWLESCKNEITNSSEWLVYQEVRGCNVG